MLRRSKTDERRPLEWDLPGGTREEGEELIEGALREIIEETSLEVEDIRPIFTKTKIRSWQQNGQEQTSNVVYIFYLAQARKPAVKLSSEHDRYKWETPAVALPQYEYPLHQAVIRHILDNALI